MKYTSIIAATALVGADAYNLKNQNKLYAPKKGDPSQLAHLFQKYRPRIF